MNAEEKKEWIKEEKELLQSRFNFFLLGTTFLITAFATVLIFAHDAELGSGRLLYFADAINIAGFWTALFFGLDNFVGACRIRAEEDRRKRACALIRRLSYETEEDEPKTLRDLICRLSCDLICLVVAPLGDRNHAPYVHTWLVPLVFAAFWLTTWGLILPHSHWITETIILSLPIIYLLILLLHGIYTAAKSHKTGDSK